MYSVIIILIEIIIYVQLSVYHECIVIFIENKDVNCDVI